MKLKTCKWAGFSGYLGNLPIVLFFYLISPGVSGQIIPENNSVVRSTQLMFEITEYNAADSYQLNLYENENTQQPVLVMKRASLAFLVDSVLQFGKRYNWNYLAFKNNRIIYKSPFYTFNTDNPVNRNLLSYRFNITTGKNTGPSTGCIFLDGCGMAINKKGEVKWFINNYDSLEKRDIGFRNIHLTPQGTVLYLELANFIEMSLHGKEIWRAPKKAIVSQDSLENYHHDCIRLTDGTYLTTSLRFEKNPCPADSANLCRFTFGTLMQFDQNSKLIWWWNEKNSLGKEELSSMVAKGETDSKSNHLNGFSFDPVSKDILISFRDNNRLIRINKISGSMKYEIANTSNPGISLVGQHSPVFINTNSYLIYNNNLQRGKKETGGQKNAFIYLIKEMGKNRLPVKVWEYECVSDSFPEGTTGKEGYAMPLPSGNILVCMGGGNRLFEVTPAKKIAWECFTSQFNEQAKKWEPFSNYRCRYYSSLYPHYFTVQQQLLTANGKLIKINNDGTDADIYEVKLHSNGSVTTLQKVTLKPFHSSSVKISDKIIQQKADTYITISSSEIKGKEVVVKL